MNNIEPIFNLFPDLEELRQKPPFRFVEKVESLDSEQKNIVAKLAPFDGKSFRPSEEVPSYILLEALAQTSGLLIMSIEPTKRGYIASMESLRFAPPVSSSVSVRLYACIEEINFPFYCIYIKANCDTRILAEGRIRIYVEK